MCGNSLWYNVHMEPVAHHYWRNTLLTIFMLGALGGLGYLGYQNYLLMQAKLSLEGELSKTKQNFASTSQALMLNIVALNQLLTATQGEKLSAEQDIIKQKELLEAMNSQVQSISGTLDTYKKLAVTDRELLAKYSKTYFLNENYTPKYSVIIPPSYTMEPEKEKMISVDVWPFLQELLDDANASAIDLKVISAFRSFDTQSTLKTIYKVTYGSGANKFSADQGYSEHQLGTTVDFTTLKLGTNYSTFEKSASYVWLEENAYKYGFILSYPKKNTYYIFEPWHWRFVGKALALKLHNENINFYDVPQRDINEYLISIFNQ